MTISFSQNIGVTTVKGNKDILFEAERFFYEYLVNNEINKKFTSFKIEEKEYLIRDSILLEKYFNYSQFKRPKKEFLTKFSDFLQENLFNSSDHIIKKNLMYILPFSSSEFYNYVILLDGIKLEKLKLELQSPFKEQLYKKEIHRFYFSHGGFIEKVEELVETSSKKDTLLLKLSSKFEYSDKLLKKKILEYKNVYTNQITEVKFYSFDKSGKLLNLENDVFKYNEKLELISKTSLLTKYNYKNGNLTEIKTTLNGKISKGFKIKYANQKISVEPLTNCFDCETYTYTLIKQETLELLRKTYF